MLLEVLAVEGEVLDDQAELGLAEVLHPRPVLELAVEVAAVGQAEDDRAALGEVVLHDAAQQRAIVDARALQHAERDDQLEAAEIVGGEVGQIGGDEAMTPGGEASAGDGERAVAVIDADQRAVIDQAGDLLGEEDQLVAGVDAEGEDARGRW